MNKSFSIIDDGYNIDQVSSYINELNIKIDYFKYLETLIDTKILTSMLNSDKSIHNIETEMDLSINIYNLQLESIKNKIDIMKSNLKNFRSSMEVLVLDISKIKSIDIVDLLDSIDNTLNILEYK